MATSIDEAKLKDLLKSALTEVLEERREFVKEIIDLSDRRRKRSR